MSIADTTRYDPVQGEDVTADDSDDSHDSNVVVPLEFDVERRQSGGSDAQPPRDDRLFSWRDPWLLTTPIVYGMVVPFFVRGILMVYELTGRIWPAFLFSLHLTAALWMLYWTIPSNDSTIPLPSLCRRIASTLLDLFLFAKLYPDILSVMIRYLFTDMDGTIVIEYTHYHATARLLRFTGLAIAICRTILETVSIIVIMRSYRRLPFTMVATDQFQFLRSCIRRALEPFSEWFWSDAFVWSELSKARLRSNLRWITYCLFLMSMGVLFWSTMSIFVHWGNWSAPHHRSSRCDPLDRTECVLPFPSMEFMIPDNTTDTGWRVNIHPDVLPRLKGGVKLQPQFLNDMDGFSTMAPLLFYMDGLKEAQEKGSNEVRLQGPQYIKYSVTPSSITALVDVDNMKLVPHSAEIDYLDKDHPLVLVFPSQPLRHNGHYALAVVGARDVYGKLLPPTPGMQALFLEQDTNDSSPRRVRFREKVLPALKVAAPWSQYNDDYDDTIQLLFDFHTISEKSQLGPIRAVRDATLEHIESEDWIWTSHVRVIHIENKECSRPGDLVARTIHAELDVPWFLQKFGPGHRGSIIDKDAIANGRARILGVAHFVVHIPCSVRAAALQEKDAASLRAIVDFGHGLFYNRAEASWGTLLRMANSNGYIVMAMDWRGMSSYDLLVVVKTLMSKPSLFQAVRDNLIQGYANKLALQHFARHVMLTMDWMSFETDFQSKSTIPLYNENGPLSIFYGISQGGILGAGYMALLGPTKLVDRAILGVPGTPFALIMSRSMDFVGYDAIMLLNFYNNRHVRIFLSLAQMLWDSCEGAGFLAPPRHDTLPRILIQAGLGDVVVPTIAAEALARALGASILPNNPRKDIFDIYIEPAADGGMLLGPNVTLTELLFKSENASLPTTDRFAETSTNAVHWCVREDAIMVGQVTEFINSGRIIDVCENNGCVREDSKTC